MENGAARDSPFQEHQRLLLLHEVDAVHQIDGGLPQDAAAAIVLIQGTTCRYFIISLAKS